VLVPVRHVSDNKGGHVMCCSPSSRSCPITVELRGGVTYSSPTYRVTCLRRLWSVRPLVRRAKAKDRKVQRGTRRNRRVVTKLHINRYVEPPAVGPRLPVNQRVHDHLHLERWPQRSNTNSIDTMAGRVSHTANGGLLL